MDFAHVVAELGDDHIARLAAVEATLTKALTLAPEHALAHFWLGTVQIQSNHAAQGIAECERALAIDQNLASAHTSIGVAKYLMGHAEETEAHVNEALRLSPRDTNARRWWAVAGFAKLLVSRYEEAVALLRRPSRSTEIFRSRTSGSHRPLHISTD